MGGVYDHMQCGPVWAKMPGSIFFCLSPALTTIMQIRPLTWVSGKYSMKRPLMKTQD